MQKLTPEPCHRQNFNNVNTFRVVKMKSKHMHRRDREIEKKAEGEEAKARARWSLLLYVFVLTCIHIAHSSNHDSAT